MRKYIIRRLLLMPVTLAGITFVVFLMTRMVPGGPVERMMQEQAISALSGDKAPRQAETGMSDESIERLEEMFHLRSPAWKAYLQWLGLMPQKVDISKAEFDDDGCAYVTLPGPEGHAVVVEVQRDGSNGQYRREDWMHRERWHLTVESPRTRAEQWAERHGVTDAQLISEKEKQMPWRAVFFHRRFCGLLQGDLGVSYKYNEPVGRMIMGRLPVSLYLGLLAACITYMVSIPLGMLKALKHRTWFDSVSSVLIFIGFAVPGFALGAVLLVYFGARLEWFPLYGLTSPGFEHLGFWDKCRDLAAHTVLPLTCYVVSSFAMATMLMKNSLMENMSSDYVRTAVAKGVSYRRAMWTHAFRNSVIPLVSTLGGVLCSIFCGSLLIERVFDIQGFGLLSFQALVDKDYSLIMGTLLVSSVLIIVGNVISDILVAYVDPRIKFDK